MEKMDLKACVRSVRDFPKEGVVFRDVTTLFQNPDAFEQLMQEMVASLQGLDVDLVLGPEARGFTVASVLAYALHAGFVPVRKPGKLPAETVSYSYDLEYGSDTLEIHRDAIRPGMRVAVADDLLATGGTDFHGMHMSKPTPLGAMTTADGMLARIEALAQSRSGAPRRGGA